MVCGANNANKYTFVIFAQTAGQHGVLWVHLGQLHNLTVLSGLSKLST